MKKSIISSVVATIGLVVPTAVAFAAGLDFPGQDGTISSLFSWATAVLNAAVGLIIGAAAVVFLYGIFQTIRGADNEETRKKGRDLMIYGIIGLAVMLSFWGIVAFVQRSFGFNSTNNAPQFNGTSAVDSSTVGTDSGYVIDDTSTSNDAAYQAELNAPQP